MAGARRRHRLLYGIGGMDRTLGPAESPRARRAPWSYPASILGELGRCQWSTLAVPVDDVNVDPDWAREAQHALDDRDLPVSCPHLDLRAAQPIWVIWSPWRSGTSAGAGSSETMSCRSRPKSSERCLMASSACLGTGREPSSPPRRQPAGLRAPVTRSGRTAEDKHQFPVQR